MRSCSVRNKSGEVQNLKVIFEGSYYDAPRSATEGPRDPYFRRHGVDVCFVSTLVHKVSAEPVLIMPENVHSLEALSSEAFNKKRGAAIIAHRGFPSTHRNFGHLPYRRRSTIR